MKEIIYDWYGYNTQLFYAINAIHAGWYDQFMIFGTMLGKYLLFPVYMLIVAVVAYVDLSRKRFSIDQDYITQRNRWISVIAVLIITYITQLLWVGHLKDFLHYPRPFVLLPEGTVIKLWDESPNSSFPSGHCTFSMLMAAGLWPILNRYGKMAAVFYVVWVGLSRIVLGMHFPADVILTFALSFLNVWLVRKVVYRTWRVSR